MKTNRSYGWLRLPGQMLAFAAQGQDRVNNNWLLYRCSVGDWIKHLNEITIDDTKS